MSTKRTTRVVSASLGRGPAAAARDRTPGLPPLTYLGGDFRGGTYVLRIRVADDIELAFGDFHRGRVYPVPAGDYAYIGSAGSLKGSTCLARRTVRHASRTGEGRPHPIRERMLAEYPAKGLADPGLAPSRRKKFKWNVDHLLDRPEAELIGAVLVRSPRGIEFALADRIVDDPAARIIARGLGANDHPRGTHLVGVDAGEDWWRALPDVIAKLFRCGRRPRPGKTPAEGRREPSPER